MTVARIAFIIAVLFSTSAFSDALLSRPKVADNASCTAQVYSSCYARQKTCFASNQCRSNPNSCKLSCCQALVQCLTVSFCDTRAFNCSN